MNKQLTIQGGGFDFKGQYVIKTFRALPEWMPRSWRLWLHKNGFTKKTRQSDTIKNLVVLNQDNGVNLFIQHLAGDPTFPLELNFAVIGTGTNPPTSADTGLQTPVVDNIIRATVEITNPSELVTEWFLTDDELPNGTYTEFGLKCNTQLFTRSLISPSHTKGSNEDTLVEYIITGSNFDYNGES